MSVSIPIFTTSPEIACCAADGATHADDTTHAAKYRPATPRAKRGLRLSLVRAFADTGGLLRFMSRSCLIWSSQPIWLSRLYLAFDFKSIYLPKIRSDRKNRKI